MTVKIKFRMQNESDILCKIIEMKVMGFLLSVGYELVLQYCIMFRD